MSSQHLENRKKRINIKVNSTNEIFEGGLFGEIC